MRRTHWQLRISIERTLRPVSGPAPDTGQNAECAERQALKLLIKKLSTAVANKLLTLELKTAAERDALTGIYNRGHLETELTEAQNRLNVDRNDHFTIILIDLIGLKAINDQHGYAAGDDLIRRVADALKSICRGQDQVFRYGGDEFVILCRSEDETGATALMHRIETHVKNGPVTLTNDDGGQIDALIQLSVGLASSDQVPPGEVLKLADERMYADKERWYRERKRYRKTVVIPVSNARYPAVAAAESYRCRQA